jgi:UDP-glucose:(heptosyl)LPS alpha-1,3-glucosyltransferase
MRSRPRIALVAHEVRAHQGIGRALRELILRAGARAEFVVVARYLDESLRPLVEWRRAPSPERPHRLKVLVFLLTASVQVARARADLVHVHTVGPTVLNRVDLTAVHLLRGASLGGSKRHSSRVHVALERRCHSRSRVLAAVSALEKADLERAFPDLPVVLTPHGVDVERFHPSAEARRAVREEEGIAEDMVVALFVANAWRQKGLIETVEGFARARASGSGPDLLWVAGYGSTEHYAAVAHELGVEAHVRFLGLRAEPERLYQAADIFVSPSAHETFSLAAFEAAACGLPVVSTRVGAVGELIRDGESGFLVERTSDDVARTLAALSKDAELRAQMGEAALRQALSFTWERSIERIFDLYGRLLAPGDRATPAFMMVGEPAVEARLLPAPRARPKRVLRLRSRARGG